VVPNENLAQTSQRVRWIMGGSCVLIGAAVVLLGCGVIAADERTLHAPRFVIVLAGVIFVAGGGMMLVPERSAWGHPFALAFFLALAIAFWWIALAAPGDGFSGGSFFLSKAANVRVARVMFGSGALLASGIVVYAVYRMIRGEGWRG
jgi:hypothetical protein